MAIAKIQYKENASTTPEVWMDTTQKTVTSGTMLSGTTALKNDGTGITGNIASKSSSDLTASGSTVTAPAGYYASSASKSVANGSATTPSTSITANPAISVNASGLITASVSGSKSVTPTVSAGYVSSGTAGTVSVSGSNTEQLSTQAGTTITPTESEQTAVASGKYTTGAVKVGAISSTYVGSGIMQRDSTDLTASGATVTAPAGYYATEASKSVASGTAGTPTATKGTVSNHSISVTPSVTNTTGYITGSTISGTAVTVDVTELESGTKSITANGTGISVSGYSAVDVNVASGYDETTITKFIDRSLTSFVFPTGIASIGSGAFWGCTYLELTSLPNTINQISQYAFYGCRNITFTSLPSNAFSDGIIGSYTFYDCRKLALTSLPSNVSSINSNAFANCYALALTSLPSTLEGIYANAFNCCKSLASISCDGAISTLSTNAFLGNSSNPMALQSVAFPNMTVTSLSVVFGSSTAAYACQQLSVVDIGKTASIAASAFANCYKLQTLILRKTDAICTLSNISAFLNTPMRGYNSLTGTVYVPNDLISTYKTATNWSTLYNNGTLSFVKIEGSIYDLS